ncbi:hypothetical protein [Streptacidiphilus sp. MAP5-52]|uniref:hypothetical protein n=1 Tax=Streptacidiphilus sp. MAP5-52 TaxID=3156267 RepID=UPI0035141942
MTDEYLPGPTAAAVVQGLAWQLSDWKLTLPDPSVPPGLPSLYTFGDCVKELNTLQFQWVSTAAFRAAQGEADPQHRDLTAGYALAAGLAGEVLQKLSSALMASAQLSVRDLRQRDDIEQLSERIAGQGNLALAEAHTSAELAIKRLNHQARRLDHRYDGARLLTQAERAEAARAGMVDVPSAAPDATASPRPPASGSAANRRSR